jgi:type IV pilus assembly protein PilW
MKNISLSQHRYAGHGRLAMRSDVRGLTLVELMISMMLGLLVVASASAIFISNKQTYRATEGLGRVQENGRMAYELMSRDLREAGGSPCGNADRENPLQLVNVLNVPTARWWSNWNNGIVGYEGLLPGGNPTNRVAGTDAIVLMSGDSSSSATVRSHDTAAARIQLNSAGHAFRTNDLAIVCNFRHAALFQVRNASSATDTIEHTVSGGVPGNCTPGLGYSNVVVCSSPGKTFQYGPNPIDAKAPATVVRLNAVRWYVGTNPDNSRSLYRETLANEGGVLNAVRQQIAEGVTDMQLQYLIAGDANYADANAIPVADWRKVVAVRISLNMLSADRAGVGGAQLARNINSTVMVRNRMQ